MSAHHHTPQRVQTLQPGAYTCINTHTYAHPQWADIPTHPLTHQYMVITTHLHVPAWNHIHVHNLTYTQSATHPMICVHTNS